MVMLSVIQKNNNPHAILRSDNEGPGGGYHDYTVMDVDRKSVIAQIRFQKGARNDPNARTGVLDADLLEIVRDRMVAHIEEALMWMAKRADDRAERGVLGTYNK